MGREYIYVGPEMTGALNRGVLMYQFFAHTNTFVYVYLSNLESSLNAKISKYTKAGSTVPYCTVSVQYFQNIIIILKYEICMVAVYTVLNVLVQFLCCNMVMYFFNMSVSMIFTPYSHEKTLFLLLGPKS